MSDALTILEAEIERVMNAAPCSDYVRVPLQVATKCRAAIASSATLEAQLAEARGEPARIVAWLRAEAQKCDCAAREEGECACGAWDSKPGERSYKRAYVEDIADAIEKRNNGR